MNLLALFETRYVLYNGELYSPHIAYDTFWKRYLDNFETVTVLARSRPVDTLPEGFIRSSGPRVHHSPIPYYKGPRQYLKKRKQIKNILSQVAQQFQAFAIRLPSPTGSLLASYAHELKKPYVVEVVGDPWESLRWVNLPPLIKQWVRRKSARQLRKIVRQASGVLYVTQNYLQEHYPTSGNVLSAGVSDVIIDQSGFLDDPATRHSLIESLNSRLADFSKPPVRLGSIGLLFPMKAPLLAVRAIAHCVERGLNLEMHFVGGGPLEKPMMELAGKLGIRDRIVSRGRIPTGAPIFEFLDSLDLYLQFSRGGEGLPRALVEAMSRGCPAIGSTVGGIPELLSEENLVPPENISALADRIQSLLSSPMSMVQAMEANLATAQEYSAPILEARRRDFYGQAAELFANRLPENA